MTIEIIKPGLSTTVQDKGRSGYYHLGIPPSGAMDQLSYKSANLLVGNEDGAAVLECALMGPEILFNIDCKIALTGADMPLTIDGVEKPNNETVFIKAGQVLTLGFATKGMRGYLAISGGLDVPIALGSRSTYSLGALGGFNGRVLAAGDKIVIGKCSVNSSKSNSDKLIKHLPVDLRQNLEKNYVLKMIPGIYDHRVIPESMRQFFNDSWSVASESDRIGYRLKSGSPLSFVPRETPFGAGDDPSNIVDACYPIGSIQVPSGAEPIILHRDAVSGGGYMMVGAVISADMDIIGQMPPNTKIKFESVTMDQALDCRREYQARYEKIKSAIL